MIDHRKLRRRMNDRFEQYVIDEIRNLRAALEIQYTRIAQIQAELDLSPDGVDRRSLALSPMTLPKLSPRGNGHGHS
jgi:hypothetical protein